MCTAPESRLKIIDTLLQKGWQSYYDFAKCIFGKDGELFLYDANFQTNRATIVQDFRIIQDVWYCARYDAAIPKVKNKSDKDPVRAEIISKVFECKTKKLFDSSKAPELIKGKDEYFSNPLVTFYRYKDSKYSIFGSGDYEKYIAFKTKKRTKKTFIDSLDRSVTDIEVNNALQDSDVVLEPEVSAQIKRSIRLQEELKEFEQGSKQIVDSLLLKISSESEQKKKKWVQDTIKYYGNVLELVKNPLSNYKPEEIATKIHEFAFFLASENQYHILGDRFDEALMIFLKLQRERKHLIDDAEQGFYPQQDVDVKSMKEQAQRDDETVASILVSIARVNLDSGNVDKARELIDKAESFSKSKTLIRAQLLHLKAVVESICGNIEQSLALINDSLDIFKILGHEHTHDSMEALASKAELLQRVRNNPAATEIYIQLLEFGQSNNSNQSILADASLNLAMLCLNDGEIEKADIYINSAISSIQALHLKEPDKYLPNLMNAKYIKGLILMQKGDFEVSISILEEAKSLIPDNRPDLYSLCGVELIEILLTLHELYKAANNTEKEQETLFKARELLSFPKIVMTEEQRFAISQILN